ncbi:uncharacterized protein LOC134176759 [Corticium candelabrum]|uniref:uncharacterized protein LOC134176759 n=1 Tax=Corticium candelabrum TaxID=121492 RepID=UPI002E27492F|nr:uncharacterized protein LOC134176759 [Corticium candelabrum]
MSRGRSGSYRKDIPAGLDESSTRSRVARRREMIRSHIEVKESDMGFVIGKGGFRIQQISTNTGAQLFTKRSVPNRIFIEAEKEEAIEKAKIEVLRVISKRDAKHDCVKWELTIDPSLIESDNEMCWKQTKIPGRRSKYYRLVPTQHALSLDAKDVLSASKAQESHSAKWMQAAEEVLTLMRKDVDKQPSTSPMTVDLWVHLGYLLFSNIAHSDGTVSVKTILSKANKGPNLRSCFESGVAGLDIDYLHRLLAEHTDGLKSTGTGICYDFDFYTPSVRKRRFTLWLQDTKKELGTVTQVDCDQTGSEEFHCS